MTLHENYIWKKSSTYMNLHNNNSAKVQNQCKKVPANHGDSSILSQQKKYSKNLKKKICKTRYKSEFWKKEQGLTENR